MATMLLGYPARTTRDFFLPGQAFVNTQEYNFYARDEWRVRRNLTLNIGAHYEVNTPFTERNNYGANFDPTRAELLIAGANGVSRRANIITDFGSLSPRFGFSWQLRPKMVVRSGYGIFFTPEGRHDTTIRQFRHVPFDLIFSIIPGALVPDNRVSQGFKGVKDFPAPDPKRPFGNLRGVAQNYRNAAVQQFNFGIQHELGASSVAGVTFVGSLGRRLTWNQPLNQPDPGPGAINPRRPFYSRFPDVVNIQWVETVGNSAYTSLQANLEKRFGKGLYFLGNWTWAHGLDNSGGDGGVNGPVPQDPRNRQADWGPQNSDIRHRVNLAWNYAAPFGSNLSGAA